MAGAGQGVHKARRCELAGGRGSAGPGSHRRTLRCHPTQRPRLHCATADTGWSSAGRVARDEAGNVVGKGDMRAQIEQVGKNVDACLKAGGATINDIIFTVNQVTAPAEFDKYADLLPRYFGPPSPKSTTIRAPQLSNPDYLLQVEAFAAIK